MWCFYFPCVLCNPVVKLFAIGNTWRFYLKNHRAHPTDNILVCGLMLRCVILDGLLTHVLLSTRVEVLYCFIWSTHSCPTVNEGVSFVLFYVDYSLMPYCQRGCKFCVVLCGLLTHALLSTRVEVLYCFIWSTYSCPTFNEGGSYDKNEWFHHVYMDVLTYPYHKRNSGWTESKTRIRKLTWESKHIRYKQKITYWLAIKRCQSTHPPFQKHLRIQHVKF